MFRQSFFYIFVIRQSFFYIFVIIGLTKSMYMMFNREYSKRVQERGEREKEDEEGKKK